VLEELGEHSVSQLGGIHDAQSHTKAKTRAREVLRAGLMEIARTARLVSRTIPQFDESFQLPRSKGDTALLHTARQFAEKAAAVSDVFIRHAMRPDFIDDLNANIQKVEEARHSRYAARATHRKATAAIDTALKKAMTALAAFDILIANILRNDGATMAARPACGPCGPRPVDISPYATWGRRLTPLEITILCGIEAGSKNAKISRNFPGVRTGMLKRSAACITSKLNLRPQELTHPFADTLDPEGAFQLKAGSNEAGQRKGSHLGEN
jgi:hypothetical protein